MIPSLGALGGAIPNASHDPKARQQLVPHITPSFEAVSKVDVRHADEKLAICFLAVSGEFFRDVGQWIEEYRIRKFVYTKEHYLISSTLS